jgi:hypothetical protein
MLDSHTHTASIASALGTGEHGSACQTCIFGISMDSRAAMPRRATSTVSGVWARTRLRNSIQSAPSAHDSCRQALAPTLFPPLWHWFVPFSSSSSFAASPFHCRHVHGIAFSMVPQPSSVKTKITRQTNFLVTSRPPVGYLDNPANKKERKKGRQKKITMFPHPEPSTRHTIPPSPARPQSFHWMLYNLKCFRAICPRAPKVAHLVGTVGSTASATATVAAAVTTASPSRSAAVVATVSAAAAATATV